MKIDDIIKAVSIHSGISYYDLIFGRYHRPQRCVIAHIVKTDCGYLRFKFAALSFRTNAVMKDSINAIETTIKNDEDLIALENKARGELSLPMFKYGIPPSKQLFGFIRSDEEEQRIQKAIDDSVKWMKKNYKNDEKEKNIR